jgi:hypothetical protein
VGHSDNSNGDDRSDYGKQDGHISATSLRVSRDLDEMLPAMLQRGKTPLILLRCNIGGLLTAMEDTWRLKITHM